MKNVAFKAMSQWILVVYDVNPPTDEEARELLTNFKAIDLERTRMLIVTKGGAPTTAQRKDLNDFLKGRSFQTAVVCDLIMVRGIVTAMSWFNSGVKSFTSAEFEGAMRYLGMPQSQFEVVRAEISKLQASLGVARISRSKV